MSETAAATPAEDKGTSLLHEFVQEAPGVWRQIPRKGLFGFLLLAWILLFHYLGNPTLGYTQVGSLFVWLKGCYDSSPDDQHGYIIPIVVFFLLWMKRKELLPAIGQLWPPGLIYLAFAALFHFAAYRVQQGRFSVIAFILGFHALLTIVWGRKWLSGTVFPLGLLIFCVPLTTSAELITFPLRMLVTNISVGIGHDILGIQIFQDGSRVMDARGQPMFDVAPACSGMRSLVAMAALSVIYAFLNFKSPWRRLAIIFCAMPMAVLGNVARITTVIIVGETLGLEKGLMIEQNFGFLTFAVAIAGMVGIGWLLREKTDQPPGSTRALPEPEPARELREVS